MNPFDKDPVRDYTSPRRPPVPLIVGLVAAVVIGLGAAVLAFGAGGGSDGPARTDSPRLANSSGPDEAATPPPCAAVLWNLSKVAIGDEISVQISGTVYTYRVTSATSVSETADWQPIVSATAKETITIITCGGSFNARTHSYDSRQVVKAERV